MQIVQGCSDFHLNLQFCITRSALKWPRILTRESCFRSSSSKIMHMHSLPRGKFGICLMENWATWTCSYRCLSHIQIPISGILKLKLRSDWLQNGYGALNSNDLHCHCLRKLLMIVYILRKLLKFYWTCQVCPLKQFHKSWKSQLIVNKLDLLKWWLDFCENIICQHCTKLGILKGELGMGYTCLWMLICY